MQEERYFQPRCRRERATLFEHCARALDRSLAVGRHGLPLMGAGDWNDGMNRVGHEGEARASGSAGSSTRPSGSFAAVAERAGRAARAQRLARRTWTG